jgi:hypothetical protein
LHLVPRISSASTTDISNAEHIQDVLFPIGPYYPLLRIVLTVTTNIPTKSHVVLETATLARPPYGSISEVRTRRFVPAPCHAMRQKGVAAAGLADFVIGPRTVYCSIRHASRLSESPGKLAAV